MAALVAAMLTMAQAPFALDTNFRAEFDTWYVSSALPLDDGNIIISGQIKFTGDIYIRSGALLNADGSRDLSFTEYPLMGGKIVPWNDKMYCANGIGLRRLWLNGLNDATFNMVNAPYFNALQGGDYHVFPDGRVVMSGVHNLTDSIRGFVGYHNFIWFTNTGYLDTTRTHRKGNGAIFRFHELPDGKFICTGTGTVYDDRPVDKIFRVHADGAVDTTFQTGVDWGEAYGYLPLPDGRVYAGGLFRFNGAPNDTMRIARFLPSGAVDPGFTQPHFTLGAIPNPGNYGGQVRSIHQYTEGRVIVTGTFQYVNGLPRRGICMLDSSGTLLDVFQDHGVWPHVYQGATYAGVQGIIPYGEDHYLVWGSYHGYSDEVNTDMAQRHITRLHGGDLHTALREVKVAPSLLRLYPNPTDGQIMIDHDLQSKADKAFIRIKDALGRSLESHPLSNEKGQLVIDTRRFEAGMYTVELINGDRMLHLERLIVQ